MLPGNSIVLPVVPMASITRAYGLPSGPCPTGGSGRFSALTTTSLSPMAAPDVLDAVGVALDEPDAGDRVLVGAAEAGDLPAGGGESLGGGWPMWPLMPRMVTLPCPSPVLMRDKMGHTPAFMN